MRPVEGLFAVGAALFVVGVGLVVVGARTTRRTSSAEQPVAAQRPVASIRQIMRGIVDPASTTIFESVSTTITRESTVEKAPKTADDWDVVGASAAALAEAGQLMMAEGRAVDRKDWVEMSQAMVDAAQTTLKAVERKDVKSLFDAGGEVYVSCDGCHQQYMR